MKCRISDMHFHERIIWPLKGLWPTSWDHLVYIPVLAPSSTRDFFSKSKVIEEVSQLIVLTCGLYTERKNKCTNKQQWKVRLYRALWCSLIHGKCLSASSCTLSWHDQMSTKHCLIFTCALRIIRQVLMMPLYNCISGWSRFLPNSHHPDKYSQLSSEAFLAAIFVL